jgi:membrane protein implicated in regulation of membrane protease activity
VLTLFQDQATLFLIAGLVLIAIDLFVVGVSPLMFIACGALLTSGVLYVGWLDPDLLGALLLCVVLSFVTALLGWYPLRRLEGTVNPGPVGSDLVGRELETTGEVDRKAGTIRWSGTEWRARLDASAGVAAVPAGTAVRITAVDGVTLIVLPVE